MPRRTRREWFSTLVVEILAFLRYRPAGEFGVALGLVVIAWIVIQVAMIGLGHWLQPLCFALGVIEMGLGFLCGNHVRQHNTQRSWELCSFLCEERA